MKNINYLLFLLVISSFSVFASPNKEYSEKFEIDDLEDVRPVELKLYVFNCGEILVREKSLFNPALPEGLQMTLSDTCYLIKHPKGTLMWDTGLSDGLSGLPNGIDVAEGVFNLSVTKTLSSQLEEINVDPLSIDYIAFSHLHFDHTANARYFQNATWLIQKPEYKAAFSPEAVSLFFNPDDYSSLKDNETIQLDGHYDVFNDGSVVILSTPGHTPGHQNLFLNLPETGPIILSGDLYHFEENRAEYVIPVFNTSKRETVHSFVLIDNVIDGINASLWIQHDKQFMESLRLSPEFYK